MIGRRALLLSGVVAPLARAQSAKGPWNDTRDNLMVVVRESVGADKQDEVLTPVGKSRVKLADGREIDFDAAWWNFIGDTHIRFVFDGADTMRGATAKDFERLKIANVDEALALAMANVKRVYGEPSSTPWSGGVMEVAGKSPDLNSSYFLDRAFWRGLLVAQPEGVVVAVPKRGGLLYTPVGDLQSVAALRRGVAMLHATSGSQRVSSALYLFKDDRWSVFQAAAKP